MTDKLDFAGAHKAIDTTELLRFTPELKKYYETIRIALTVLDKMQRGALIEKYPHSDFGKACHNTVLNMIEEVST